jgi:hypothetical protein
MVDEQHGRLGTARFHRLVVVGVRGDDDGFRWGVDAAERHLLSAPLEDGARVANVRVVDLERLLVRDNCAKSKVKHSTTTITKLVGRTVLVEGKGRGEPSHTASITFSSLTSSDRMSGDLGVERPASKLVG